MMTDEMERKRKKESEKERVKDVCIICLDYCYTYCGGGSYQ